MTTTSDTTALRLKFLSFGFKHRRNTAPRATLVLDVGGELFRDPHISPDLRALTGRDHAVISKVLSTKGIGSYLDRQFLALRELALLDKGLITVAVGCRGGRHRAPVCADQLAWRCLSAGLPADVEHLDIDKPVLTG